MRKFLLLMIALLAGVSGAWATVTMPTLTTDVDNPHYYTIKNYRSNKYAAYAGPSTQLAQVSSITMEALWYFMENGDGVYIIPAVDPSVKLVSNTSADATGSKWYLVENPHRSDYFCVTLSSTAATKCWDDNASHTGVGYWQPSAGDNAGTSWTIEASATTLAEVIDYRREQILPTINALPEVLKPAAKMTALNDADTDGEFRAAVADFSANVTFLCRSGKYLEVGDAQGIISSTTKTDAHVIQLESVGDGTFYIRGFKSMKYMGDVQVSTAIKTEASPNIPYYIQGLTVSEVEYAVARPTKYADSGNPAGFHYIHNGGSGCVGWESAAANTQFTIETADLPSGYCAVTYNVELNDEVIAQETKRETIGSTTAIPTWFERDYTTYSYDVATIPDAATATITATATVSGLPFTVSNNYEDATWYYMQLHTTWKDYVSTNGDDILWASGSSSSDKYFWAFMGNPIQGFKVINRAAGNTKYLTSTNPATMTTTPTAWILKRADATHFGLTDESLGSYKYANGQGSTIKYWWQFDAGSQFWVTEVTADEIEFVDDVAALKAINWGLTASGNKGKPSYYNLTGTCSGDAGNETSIITELETEGYDAERLTKARDMLDNYDLNMPSSGFYRIQGHGGKNSSEKYLAAGMANSKYAMSDATDATTIFYFDGTILTNLSSGMCNGMTSSNWSWVLGSSASTVTFHDGNKNGGYGIQSANRYFYDAGTNADRGTDPSMTTGDDRYRSWFLTEITTLPITITGAGYATLYSPVKLTVPAGITVYAAANAAGYLTLTQVAAEGDVIPANTGVILAGAEGSYNFVITDADPVTVDTNVLEGTAVAITKPAEAYYLSNGDSGVGFYKEGSATTLAGFRAYLPAGLGVKGFLGFEFDDADGIKTIDNGKLTIDNAEIYNLAGQRVNKLQRGVNIVNGKKVIVK